MARYRQEGVHGLHDRPSGPRRCPHRTAAVIEARIREARRRHRRGADWIGAELGIAPATVGRVLARHRVPRLSDLDALTGEPVRHGSISSDPNERQRPGELVHVDVKKLGRIPEGGGGRANGRDNRPERLRGQGFEYVHAAIDDHSRLAYAEIHPDERGTTCAGFLVRAAAFFASHGISRIERVMTDNALNYRRSADFGAALTQLGARHVLIRPHCPWTNGKVERLNRTLLREWAYSQVFRSTAERAACLPEWLWHYNTRRRHSSLGGLPPISRLSTTW